MILSLKNILFVIFILTFLKCSKRHEVPRDIHKIPDTLKPLSYYPVFPGSFWIYLNEKNDSVKHFTAATYLKHCAEPGVADTFVVPFLNKPGYIDIPIYQYHEISRFTPYMEGFPMYRRTPILSEQTGSVFRRGGLDTRYKDMRPFVKVDGKFKIGNDSVLVLTGTYEFLPLKFIEFYSKDIGLSRRVELNSENGDTLSQLVLVKYHINK